MGKEQVAGWKEVPKRARIDPQHSGYTPQPKMITQGERKQKQVNLFDNLQVEEPKSADVVIAELEGEEELEMHYMLNL